MKKVFIADNNFDTLYTVSAWLTKQGYYVRTFSCLQPLFDALEETVPDLILLDINLPGTEGKDICRKIKKEYSENILVILSSDDSSLPEKRRTEMPNNLLHKPLQLQQISNTIQACLN